MSSSPRAIALIPARSGSKRVPDKNVRTLGEHPVLAYTIAAATASKVFQSVVVSTDSEDYAAVARHYGAEVPFLRPAELSGDRSPDIEWVEFTIRKLKEMGREYECFSILRPTSPFRQAATIQRAWAQFILRPGFDSLRAVEKCREHPGKMWVVRGECMYPVLAVSPAEQPWHSSQYAALPEVYVQNASLELAWTRVVFNGRSIAGNVIMPFFTEGVEGVDVNDTFDWEYARYLLSSGQAILPQVVKQPFKK